MIRTSAPVALSLLVVLWPAEVVRAGPPEVSSGRMVLDEVADGLRRYRRETDPGRRRQLLSQLAPSRDPRVAVALGEVLASTAFPFPEVTLLAEFYLPESNRGSTDSVWDWWRANEDDLRRRARQLP
jgi:hypothetical protein